MKKLNFLFLSIFFVCSLQAMEEKPKQSIEDKELALYDPNMGSFALVPKDIQRDILGSVIIEDLNERFGVFRREPLKEAHPIKLLSLVCKSWRTLVLNDDALQKRIVGFLKDRFSNDSFRQIFEKWPTKKLLASEECNVSELDRLHLAIKGNYYDLVEKCLVKNQEIVNQIDDNEKETALHIASRYGRFEIVEQLVAKGAKIDAVNKNGYTPLLLALYKDRSDVAEFLIKKGAAVNGIDIYNLCITPLVVASTRGNIEIVQKLLFSGADINKRDLYGYTALHAASENAQFAVVDLLIDKGAQINTKSYKDDTPLHIKARLIGGSEEIIKKFVKKAIEAGVDINAQDKAGNTPLHTAITKSAVFKEGDSMIRILLGHGADMNVQNNLQQTPLRNAKKKKVIKVLTEHSKKAAVPAVSQEKRIEKEVNENNSYSKIKIAAGLGLFGITAFSLYKLWTNNASANNSWSFSTIATNLQQRFNGFMHFRRS